MQCSISTNSSQETVLIAESIGARLKGGEVIELVSDLGGGKTTFVQGLAKGFGSQDRVASPTFTVSKVYKAGDKEMHHFDFYRLQDAGIIAHEITELVGEPNVVVVVEWAEVVHKVLPADRLTIALMRTGDASRELSFECPDKLGYLVESVC